MFDSRLKVLRGPIDHLEGSQDHGLISWARFHLGYHTVLLHGLFVHVPELEEGDEVEVVGQWAGQSFEGLVCRKIGVDAAYRQRMKEQRSRREIVWGTILGALGLTMAGFLVAVAPGWLWLLWSLFVVVSWAVNLWGRLALAREAESLLSSDV